MDLWLDFLQHLISHKQCLVYNARKLLYYIKDNKPSIKGLNTKKVLENISRHDCDKLINEKIRKNYLISRKNRISKEKKQELKLIHYQDNEHHLEYYKKNVGVNMVLESCFEYAVDSTATGMADYNKKEAVIGQYFQQAVKRGIKKCENINIVGIEYFYSLLRECDLCGRFGYLNSVKNHNIEDGFQNSVNIVNKLKIEVFENFKKSVYYKEQVFVNVCRILAKLDNFLFDKEISREKLLKSMESIKLDRITSNIFNEALDSVMPIRFMKKDNAKQVLVRLCECNKESDTLLCPVASKIK